jgi:hypothetical protein
VPGGAGTTGQAFTCGFTNGAITPTLRAEGYTEQMGDMILICSGGPPTASNTGVAIPTANFTIFLNTTVTSREISVILKPKARAAVPQNGGAVLSREDFGAKHGADGIVIEKVKQFARETT